MGGTRSSVFQNPTRARVHLYDDGGLTLLLPYILKTRAKFAKCQMRVFFLANKMNSLDEEARSMAALLVNISKCCDQITLVLHSIFIFLFSNMTFF